MARRALNGIALHFQWISAGPLALEIVAIPSIPSQNLLKHVQERGGNVCHLVHIIYIGIDN